MTHWDLVKNRLSHSVPHLVILLGIVSLFLTISVHFQYLQIRLNDNIATNGQKRSPKVEICQNRLKKVYFENLGPLVTICDLSKLGDLGNLC